LSLLDRVRLRITGPAATTIDLGRAAAGPRVPKEPGRRAGHLL